jgi:hypothetical protein
MGIIAGNNSTMQIGLETTWGTPATPTKQLEFTSESLVYNPNYQESPALKGNKTAGEMYVSNINVSGSFDIIVHPDNIGLLLGATFGTESDATVYDTSTDAYQHDFTLIEAGTSTSLPNITALIDRIVDVFSYDGLKVNSMELSAESQGFLTASFDIVGRDETEGASLETGLSYSALPPYQFKHGTIQVDGSDYADVTSMTLNVSNNLETDLYTLNSGQYMVEPEPQKREVTASLDVLYSSTTNTTRSNKFKSGSTISVSLKFVADEEIESGYPYELWFEMPLAYITEASPNVSGEERITQTLSVTATQDSSNEPITATLIDSKDTKYLS